MRQLFISSRPASHQICRVRFLYCHSSCSYQCSYSSAPSARVRYPFGKQKGEKGKETFGKQPSVNIRVVTKWYAKVPPANFCHRKPTKVPQMSYSGRLTCRGFFIQKKTAPKSSLFFVSSRKGFMRLCRLFQSFRV